MSGLRLRYSTAWKGLAGFVGAWALTFAAPPALAQGGETSKRVLVPPQRALVKPTKAAKKKAGEHYGKLGKLYRRGRYKKALPHARAMWRLVPNRLSAQIYATILMSEKLERACEAFEVLLTAMDLPASAAKPAEMIELLNRAGAECIPASGWARIVVNPDGAVATLSGVRVIAPRTVGMSPGTHTLVVTSPGYHPGTQKVEVYAGMGATVQINLQKEIRVVQKPPVVKPIVAEGKTAASVVTPKPVEPPDHTGAFALIGVGAAGLVAGGVMFGLAVADQNEYAELTSGTQLDASAEKIESLRSRGQLLEIAGYVAGGVGLVSLVTGIALYATASPSAPEAVTLGPVMLPSGGGVTVGGRF